MAGCRRIGRVDRAILRNASPPPGHVDADNVTLVVFLVLAALYESWAIQLSVMLVVPRWG